jgi:hypothetical protein
MQLHKLGFEYISLGLNYLIIKYKKRQSLYLFLVYLQIKLQIVNQKRHVVSRKPNRWADLNHIVFVQII